MRIELYHASKYGNGERVAMELQRLLTARGNEVNVHHISDVSPREMPPADLYIFGSPTHFGKAVGGAVRFLKKANLPPGARYAAFTTCSAARPDKKTGVMPTEEELEKMRLTIPMIDEQLSAKGMSKIADMKFFVKPEDLKGPLEDGWQVRAETFAEKIAAAFVR